MAGDFKAVSLLNATDIEDFARSVRDAFHLGGKKVQMAYLLEIVLREVLPGYDFFVLPDDEMPGMEGYLPIGKREIYLSNSSYVALCNGDPDARHVAAHEFGHLLLHSHQTPVLAKRRHTDRRVDPEWQADHFADCWLVPSEGVRRCRSARHVAAKFNVSDEVARRRFDEVMNHGIQGELF